MRKIAWAMLVVIVLIACQEDDGKPANTLTVDTETSELSTGYLIIAKSLDGADYYHVSLTLNGPPWAGSSIRKNSVDLSFISATPDLAEGSYTIVTRAEVNGHYKPDLALPGTLWLGVSVDIEAGTSILQMYHILKGNVQVKKTGDTYTIEFQGEGSTDVDHMPISFLYTGKLAKHIQE